MTPHQLISLIYLLFVSFTVRAVSAESPPMAFVHVNVIPMDHERVIEDATVLVENGRIVSVGTDKAPAGTEIVDGQGREFLSPGLSDMHTHADTLQDMQVYLANGVTSVLNMGGASNGFVAQTRVRLNNGEKAGPHVYVAMMVDGSRQYGHLMVSTPMEARAAVILAKANGFQFIKVYDDLSPQCFAALMEEAKRLKLGVVGHSVAKVGLRSQIEAGQIMIAHSEEFIYTFFLKDPEAPPEVVPSVADIPAAVDLIKRHGTFVTADLNTYATIARQWGRPDVQRQLAATPERRYLAPRWRIEWGEEDYADRPGSVAGRLEFLTRFTKSMADADVNLIAGTDAPAIAGLVPGFSLHDDLDALVRAGLTRYQALSSATRIPGAFIRQVDPDDRFGTITTGSRADLVLTENNPLQDLGTLRTPLGVMANGRWHPREGLQAMLADVEARYNVSLCGIPDHNH